MLPRRSLILTAVLAPHGARAAGPDLWDALRAGAVALFRHANGGFGILGRLPFPARQSPE